jgi:hypothetical protein
MTSFLLLLSIQDGVLPTDSPVFGRDLDGGVFALRRENSFASAVAGKLSAGMTVPRSFAVFLPVFIKSKPPHPPLDATEERDMLLREVIIAMAPTFRKPITRSELKRAFVFVIFAWFRLTINNPKYHRP